MSVFCFRLNNIYVCLFFSQTCACSSDLENNLKKLYQFCNLLCDKLIFFFKFIWHCAGLHQHPLTLSIIYCPKFFLSRWLTRVPPCSSVLFLVFTSLLWHDQQPWDCFFRSLCVMSPVRKLTSHEGTSQTQEKRTGNAGMVVSGTGRFLDT